MATQKLLHYFTDHEVAVVTSYPLEDIVRNRNIMGRISKWALELMGHDIRYITCTAIKSQALTNFVAEWTKVQLPTQTSPMSTRQCTLMGPSWCLDWGLEWF